MVFFFQLEIFGVDEVCCVLQTWFPLAITEHNRLNANILIQFMVTVAQQSNHFGAPKVNISRNNATE